MLRNGSNGKQQPGTLGKGAGGRPQPEIKVIPPGAGRDENRPAPQGFGKDTPPAVKSPAYDKP
jgi:hypothetical protein